MVVVVGVVDGVDDSVHVTDVVMCVGIVGDIDGYVVVW